MESLQFDNFFVPHQEEEGWSTPATSLFLHIDHADTMRGVDRDSKTERPFCAKFHDRMTP